MNASFIADSIHDSFYSFFTGVTGKVTMDTNADRINDYWVWQLPEGNEGFEPVSIINAGLETGQVLE